MPDEIEIKVDNSEVKKLLSDVVDKTKNSNPLMLQLAEILRSAIELQFEAQGYGKWPQLKQSTIDARTKKGTWPGKMLQDSLQLINSIQTEATNDSARAFTNKIYAPKQQFGFKGTESVGPHTRKTKKGETSVKGFARVLNLEPRPFFELTDWDHEQLLEAVGRFIVKE